MTPVHDVHGNLSSDGTRSYVYDWQNRLVEVRQGGQTVGEYTYDALNRRVSKSTPLTSGVTTYYYDNAQVIEEHEEGNYKRAYVYGQYVDDPLMMESGGQDYFYLKDRQYGIRAVADNAGNEVERYDYTAFGRMTVYRNNAGNWIETSESQIGNTYGYTGRQWDKESGLWYYRNRMYSPTLGRFLQRDPAGYVDGMNLYAYVLNNPLAYLDPWGLKVQTWADTYWVDPINVSQSYVNEVFRNVADQYDNPLAHAALAVAKTVTDVVLGVGKALPALGKEIAQFAYDPKLENIPVLGSMGTAIGESWGEALTDGGFVNYSKAIGNTLFGVDLVLGGYQAASSITGRLTSQGAITDPARLLPAPRSGSINPDLPGGRMVSFEVGQGGLRLPSGRAHGANPAGGFLSAEPIPNQSYVRGPLATHPEWNPATQVSDVFVPQGVRLQMSVANPHPSLPSSGYGVQFQILNEADKARIIYSNPRLLP